MKERRLRRAATDLLRLGVMATIAVTAVLPLASGLPIPTAEASVAADRKDDGKDKKDKKQDDDRGEDFVLNGQVLEINTDKNPPEMIVGTVDGRARVRVIKTDEIAKNGVEIGDFVELTGEKVNELLFNADEISVGERASASGSDNDNSVEDDEDED
jgi:hypothetical protein